jgi:hypothetical protein
VCSCVAKLGEDNCYLPGFAFLPINSTTKSKTMQITLERTGGFAGITRKKTVDTAILPANEAKDVLRLATAADLFNLPAQIISPNPQSDRFQYRLTVEDNGKQHTIIVSEAALPGTLRPLIEWLNNVAVQRKETKD